MTAPLTLPSGARLEYLRELARAHRVQRLDLFGSVARGAAGAHDYDFLVEFEPLPPLEHGRAYLSLLAALQETLAAPVDLVEAGALDNPYFEAQVRRERVNIYARRPPDLAARPHQGQHVDRAVRGWPEYSVS